MWQLVTDLRQRVGRYVYFGDHDAVCGEDVVPLVHHALRVTAQALPNGPAGLEREGLNAAAGVFLCRCHAAGCERDHTAELDLFCSPGAAAQEYQAIRLLDTARVCLLARSWQRLADGDMEVLVSVGTSWEMDLLDRVTAEVADAGRTAAGDTAAAYCIASQHWVRYLALPPDERDAELTASLAGFEEIYRPGATVVPPLVREYLDSLSGELPAGPAPYAAIRARSLGRSGTSTRAAARAVLSARWEHAQAGTDEAELSLCQALAHRGLLAGRRGDLDEAIGRNWPIWTRLLGQPGPAVALAAATLLHALVNRAVISGEDGDLRTAIDLGVATLNENKTPADSWAAWGVITCVAAASSELASRTRSPEAVDLAIQLVKIVIHVTTDAHLSNRDKEAAGKDLLVESCFGLSHLYKDRYDLSGHPDDLETAARAGGYAAAEGVQYGMAWKMYGYGVAEVFFARYQAGHNIADLDQAITMLRSLLWQEKLRSEETPMLSEREKLGQWLTERFNTLGYVRDLDEALGHLTAVAEAAEGGLYPAGASLFTNAASLLSGSASSAEQARQAVAWARRALTLCAPGSQTASYAWGSLGRGLHRLHEYDADPAILDEALGCLRRALGGRLPDMYRADMAYELARVLATRNGEDDPATLRATESAAAVAPHGRLRYRATLMLAGTLLGRARRAGGDPAARRRAVALLEEAALGPDNDDQLRVNAALGWAQEAIADGDFASGARAFRAAIEGLPSPLWWAGSLQQRRERIGKLSGFARAAAACALRAGMPEHALESLERGRAMLWGQAMQMRAAARRVATVDPRLGERFAQALTEQEGLARAETRPYSFQDYMGAQLTMMQQSFFKGRHPNDMRLAAAKNWQDLVAQARGIPGLEDVMRASRAAALRDAAAGGAAVLVNVHAQGSHALIVRPAGVDGVSLPELTMERTQDMVADFWLAVHLLDLGVFDLASRRRVEATMAGTRRWLWDAIAGPVLEHLGLRDTPPAGAPWPRLWWCPTTALSMLPLHAAGDDEGGQCTLDRAVSSYTVTLTTLAHARASAPAAGSRSILAVDVGELRGAPTLPGTAQELDDLEACFPGEVTRLEGARAGKAALREEMKGHSWLHLACHARQGFGDEPPALYLHDGPLGIDGLGWSASGEAALAYLSACSTAETAMDVADEAHHLAAAFQITGYRHVIATQWGANDRIGVRVAREFYDYLRCSGSARADAAAEALHHAMRVIREEGHSAYLWAPYVHYGL